MRYIPLQILDEYAKKLTPKQAAMLYESKVGGKYEAKLFESAPAQKTKGFNFYLNAYSVANEAQMSKNEFLFMLGEKHNDVLSKLSVKLDEDSITFIAPGKDEYKMLIEALRKVGISGNTILSGRDKNL